MRNQAKREFSKKILVETKNTGGVFGFLHMKIFAEINFPCLLVLDNGFLVAFDQNLACAYDVCARSDFKSVANVVVCDKHADVFLCENFYDSFDVGYRNRVDSSERLVQKKKFWLDCK